MKYKTLYIDTETTGADRKLHHIHQIGGIITDGDGKELERFSIEFCPKDLSNCSPEALQKTRLTLEELAARPKSHGDAYREFTAILAKYCNKYNRKDKMFICGFNVSFDTDFLREFFLYNGDSYFGSWFWHPCIDVMLVTAWLTQNVRGDIQNFKLETICNFFGISWDESKGHDAFYDVEKTREVHCKLNEMLQ